MTLSPATVAATLSSSLGVAVSLWLFLKAPVGSAAFVLGTVGLLVSVFWFPALSWSLGGESA